MLKEKRGWIAEIVDLLKVLIPVIFFKTFIFGLFHTPTGSAEPNILIGDYIFAVKYPYVFDKAKKIKHGDLVIFDDARFEYDQNNVLNRLWQKYAGWFAVPLLGLTPGPTAWVKRVIALPGDTIEGRVEGRRTEIYLNGQKLVEPYLNPYPLICIQRSVGIFPASLGLPFGLSKKTEDPRPVAYNPRFPHDEQPFYCFCPEEVVLNYDGNPIILSPRMPTNVDTFGPITVPPGKFWGMGDNRRGSDDSRRMGLFKIDSVYARPSRILWSRDSTESSCLIDLFKNPIEFFTKQLRWSRFGRSLQPFDKVYET